MIRRSIVTLGLGACTLVAPATALADLAVIESNAPSPNPPPAAKPPAAAPTVRPLAVRPLAVRPRAARSPAAAPAASTPEADATPAQPTGLGRHQSNWETLLGVRTAFVTDAGFDPFAEDNALVQVSFGAGRTLFARDSLSLAAVGFWDFGSKSATARAEPTQLVVHRVTLGPELRWHLMPQLYAFTRVAPAALHLEASLSESSSGSILYSRGWVFGADATAGVAAELYGRRSGAATEARFWMLAEGGYGWAARRELSLAPDEDDAAAPQRLAALDLGSVAVRGAIFRVSAALTF